MKHSKANTNDYDIGFDRAFDVAMSCVIPMASEMVSPALAVGRACAETLYAAVDSPSLDASVKDGYAVVSTDLADASRDNPITLQIIDYVGAGSHSSAVVSPGKTIQILSGAPIPAGADAVLAEEFAEIGNGAIRAVADAQPGRNILRKGADVAVGEKLVEAGRELTPAIIGRLVGGGISETPVHKRPRVGLLGTGDEVLLPGSAPQPGKLFASNLALQQAWFSSRGIHAEPRVAGDSMESLTSAIKEMLPQSDVIITSGGAWKGDRDLIVAVLQSLGWELKFHRVRMGPGKAVGMGLLEGKPIFCLPGGPPSNEMAFLMIAFPAIHRMAGHCVSPFLNFTASLESDVVGQLDWTQFVHCRIIKKEGNLFLRPLEMKRRLASMSEAQAIFRIPEGVNRIPAAAPVSCVCLDPGALS